MPNSSNHPYQSFIHTVEKPARYLGGEYNSVVKDWADMACTFALCFPDVYDIGMSHLGTKILYSVVNKSPNLVMERCFCPWPDMEAALREHGLPLLSLETHQPLSAFDVVGFSLQYEMTFTNVLTMLDLGGVPLHNADRTGEHPLVIAGGPVATQPEPLAPFIDAFLIGDAEERLPRLLEHVGELRRAGVTRRDILVALAKEGGVYCPDLYTRETCPRSGRVVVGAPLAEGVPARVQRAFLEDISRYRFPSDSPVAVAEAIFDRLSVEIARGCTEGCRFCQAGMIYRPVRERDPEEVVQTVLEALDNTGYDEASITSLSTADYSCVSPLIKRLMGELRQRKVGLGISSLRAYGLDEDLLDEIASVKATGLTFAPEAGTQRMRNVISKNISEDDIFTTCQRVFARGWNRIKLYFMIGLPTEEDADVEGIALMGKQAVQLGKQHTRGPKVTVSVSTHVPKPHTPFQWCAQDSLADISRKQKMLLNLARPYGYNFRYHDMRVSHLEGILSRADIRAAWLIEHAWRLGARFDGWDEHLAWDVWQQALDAWEQAHSVSRHDFLATLPVDGRLPWDHIDVGLADGFLAKEYKKAVKGRPSPPCGKPVGAQVHHTNVADAVADRRKLVCYHCGVACDLTQMREERVDALTRLGALEPPTRDDVGTAFESGRERFLAGLTPHDFGQGRAVRYRLRFTKLGPVSLQGGLDVARMLPQIARRAGLPLFYTEGFQPRPLLTLGPALALGAKSLCEYADVGLTQGISASEVMARLNAHSPPGMTFTGVRRLERDDAGVAKRLATQIFVAHLGAHANARDLEEAIARARAQPELSLAVERKGRTREVALWHSLEALEAAPLGELATHLGVPEHHLALWMHKRADTTTASLRPAEIVRVVLDRPLDPTNLIVARALSHTGEDPLVADGVTGLLDVAECAIPRTLGPSRARASLPLLNP